MPERKPAPRTAREARERFRREVARKERRKLRARAEGDRGVWFGLGMFGLVGWAVAVPTVAGIAIGVWADQHHPGRYSWTLLGLGAGIALGCVNAWVWVKRESGEDG